MESVRLNGWLADKAVKVFSGIGVLGLLLSVYFFTVDAHHLMFSYLTVFTFFLALCLGALFFVIIQHLFRAGWGVVLRRLAEVLAQSVWVLAILFLPILYAAFDGHLLFHWSDPAYVAKDAILQGKAGYLNVPFFTVRAIIFFAAWIGLSQFFLRKSVQQDNTGDKAITHRLRTAATFGVIVFAITLTFSSIDWVMSLTPHWYSTMFGVHFFANAVVLSIASIILLALLLRKNDLLTDIITVEHYHDLGKLLYGFNIFWAYIVFSQYFLIWTGNIPEETIFYHLHTAGTWNAFSYFLAIGHFFVPFVLFMSRHAKRHLFFNACVALWLGFMTYIDLYWIIMPNATPDGVHMSIMDLASFLMIGGFFLAVLFFSLKRVSLYPIKDPLLEESVSFKNH